MSPRSSKSRAPADTPRKPEPSQPPAERLQKVLASAGLGSRRKCEEYILEGRVTVDGEVVEDLGMRVDPRAQDISVDHVSVRPQRKVYFVLNKPKGVLCTNSDPSGRTRIIDLFPGQDARLFPIGRLDENSEGLILVTNDGELGNRLAHPRYGLSRTYRVQVAGSPTKHTLDQLREGLYFSEGKFRVESVKRVGSRGRSTMLELVLNEGKNREIRRLLARVGHKVQQLRRIGFGPLRLGNLEVGRYRRLTPAELAALRNSKGTPRRSAAPGSAVSTPRKKVKADQADASAEQQAARVGKPPSTGVIPPKETGQKAAGQMTSGRKPSREKPKRSPRSGQRGQVRHEERKGEKPGVVQGGAQVRKSSAAKSGGRKSAGRTPIGPKPSSAQAAGKKRAGKASKEGRTASMKGKRKR